MCALGRLPRAHSPSSTSTGRTLQGLGQGRSQVFLPRLAHILGSPTSTPLPLHPPPPATQGQLLSRVPLAMLTGQERDGHGSVPRHVCRERPFLRGWMGGGPGLRPTKPRGHRAVASLPPLAAAVPRDPLGHPHLPETRREDKRLKGDQGGLSAAPGPGWVSTRTASPRTCPHPPPASKPDAEPPRRTGEEEELALHLINESTSQSMSQAVSPSWAREQGTGRPHPGGQWAVKASCVRVGLGSMDGWAQGEWRIPHLGTG